jgi:hypothetical protein
MKSLTIQKLIEDSVTTGEPVTESFMLGARSGEDEKSPVIDIEPVGVSSSPPQLLNSSGSKLGQRDCRQSLSVRDSSVGTRASCLSTKSVSPSISPEVKSALAKIDGSGLPSDMCSPSKAGIFRALVEFEFSILPAGEKIEVVRKLGHDGINTWLRGGRWNVANGQEFGSIITLAVMLLKRERNKAALVVGSLLGIKPEYCFRTYPQKDDIPSALPLHNPQVREQIPRQLLVLDRNYELKVIHYMRDFRGNKEHAICYYVDSADPQNSFFLPATRVEVHGNPTLTIGMVPVPARLYARAQMAKLEGATVLLCQNMRVAMELSRLANEARLFERERIIISGCYGGATAFPALKLDDLAGHDVVLLLEPTRESLIDAPSLAKRCVKAGVASVSIYPWPVTAGDDLVGAESVDQGSWKDSLFLQAEHLDEIERPSKFVRTICNRALSISDYKKYIIDIGVVSASRECSEGPSKSNVVEEIRFFSLGEISDDNLEDDGPLTLEQIFNPENSSVAWGPTGSAKSWLADEVAIGYSTGTEAFGIPAIRSHVVLILDGEISARMRKKHLIQLLQNRPGAVKLANQNIHVMPPMANFRRFDEEYADILIPKLQLMKVELLIIDNLQALDPKAGKHSSDKLNRFIQKLEYHGIAVFIVHHSDKEGTSYKGPTDLTDLAQNVFKLEGRKQVRMLKSNSEQVEMACEEGGPVIRLTVEKTKICGFEDCSVIYHLPMYGVWEWLEGELSSASRSLPERNSSDPTDGEKDSPLFETVKVIDLSPDEEKVCVALKGRKCMRAELETLTGFKTDKLGGILRKLVRKKLVEKKGVGKATYYRGV